MKVYLFIRHAQPLENGHLSSQGIHQAETCAMRLHDFPKIDLICVSPAARAQETAHVIKKKLGLDAPVITIQQLSLDSQKNSQYEINLLLNKYAPAQDTTHLDPGCLEAFLKIKELEKKHKAQVILIVGHALRLNALGLEFSREALFFNSLDLAYARGFYIKQDLSGTFLAAL